MSNAPNECTQSDPFNGLTVAQMDKITIHCSVVEKNDRCNESFPDGSCLRRKVPCFAGFSDDTIRMANQKETSIVS